MTLQFYDMVADGGRSSLIDVDRVYKFDWDRFTQSDWDALARVFRLLPNFVESADASRWFSTDESSDRFLVASVEPPGLQITGRLPRTDWLAWHDALTRESVALPSCPLS
jgi:hypothetical protein